MSTKSLPHQSNAATFKSFVTFYDEDDELLDISTVDEISVRIRNPWTHRVELEATLTGGAVVETGDGTVQYTFTAAQMINLEPGQYELGVLVTVDDVTEQTDLRALPVIEGL